MTCGRDANQQFSCDAARRSWFQWEILPGSWLNSSKTSGPFFFLLRIMLRSCSKLKVNLLIKRPCSQQEGGFRGFWRGTEQFIFLLKITAELFRSPTWQPGSLLSQSVCMSEGAAPQGQGFARMLKAFIKQRSSDGGGGGRVYTSSKWDLKSQFIMLLAFRPSFCLHFMRDGCPSCSFACWS